MTTKVLLAWLREGAEKGTMTPKALRTLCREAAATIERLTRLSGQLRFEADSNAAALAKAQQERDGYLHHLRLCEQIAGKVLGYPRYADDQNTFPGATEEDGVCIGEHVGDTIVAELASALAKAREALTGIRRAADHRRHEKDGERHQYYFHTADAALAPPEEEK